MKKQTNEPLTYPFNSELFYSHWEMWKQYKKEQFKFTYKGTISEQAALKKLSEDSGHNEDIAIKMIEQAIAFGWMGIYPLKTNGKQQTNNQSIRDSIRADFQRDLDNGFS